MTNWRVIKQRDSDGTWTYTIQDVYPHSSAGMNPFVEHRPPYPVALSVDDLRARLMEMLSALDSPPLELIPRRLREVLP